MTVPFDVLPSDAFAFFRVVNSRCRKIQAFKDFLSRFSLKGVSFKQAILTDVNFRQPPGCFCLLPYLQLLHHAETWNLEMVHRVQNQIIGKYRTSSYECTLPLLAPEALALVSRTLMNTLRLLTKASATKDQKSRSDREVADDVNILFSFCAGRH